VTIVGGVNGYLDGTRGEAASVFVRPTAAGDIRVRFYDMNGVLVRNIVVPSSGGLTLVISWNLNSDSGQAVPAGVYPILVEAPGIEYRDKLVVVR